MSISNIAIPNAGGKTVCKTAQSAYLSRRDKIRIQIFTGSQTPAKVKQTVKWNRGPVTTWLKLHGSWFQLGNKPTKT